MAGSMVDEVHGQDPSEMSKEEILDEIAEVGNYTDREMKLREELINKKLEESLDEG